MQISAIIKIKQQIRNNLALNEDKNLIKMHFFIFSLQNMTLLAYNSLFSYSRHHSFTNGIHDSLISIHMLDSLATTQLECFIAYLLVKFSLPL